MAMSYSPHREAGGTLHISSPTLAHKYSIEGFDSIRNLRKSLSRSPSRPQRFQLFTSTTPHKSPASPLSPFQAAQNPSPTLSLDSDEGQPPVSPLESHHQVASLRKGRIPLRRTTPFRSSTRIKSTPNSPRRRILGDATNQGNTLPYRSGGSPGEDPRAEDPGQKENTPCKDEKPHHFRMSLNDGPIKFEYARSIQDGNTPARSSPLKRGDRIMNPERGDLGSPMAKRRSLHGPLAGSDMESLRLMFAGDGAADEPDASSKENGDRQVFSSPMPSRDSPLRKSVSLRKSTLQQRQTPNHPRSQNIEFAIPGLAASKSRQRFSLDGSMTPSSPAADLSLRRSLPSHSGPLFGHKAIPHRPSPAAKQPHPLANALSPSSSASSLCEDSQQSTVPPMPGFVPGTAMKPSGFSRSMPIGSTRPLLLRSKGGTFQDHLADGEGVSFATPDGYKSSRPQPAAFMSTGLISKKNRNAEAQLGQAIPQYIMPDTPSKRNSFPPDPESPFRRSTISGNGSNEFGSPTTPFSTRPRKLSIETFGNSITAFNARMQPGLTRSESFASLDGLDQSPTNVMESQSSNDEFPPTPTKPVGEGRRSKENSLRSSMFGRRDNRRISLSQDTFVAPELDVSSAPLRKATPTGERHSLSQTSPHTPQDHVNIPDPSSLSISGNAPAVNPFKLSTASNTSFPPATPTAGRDQGFLFGKASIAAVTKNDVDTSLTSRFITVVLHGTGEFSQVFRVEGATNGNFGLESSFSNFGKAWAVKKSKKPYTGQRDRDIKRREVEVLKELRGNEHVVNFVDSWEFKNHLYIQTEFCENGNLRDFMNVEGSKGRLDDFRIWKILLELTLGVKHIHDHGFIHLDLKPANVFVDWEGSLKVGDFGLATEWPAPYGIDGEGDRGYIAPEVLTGKLDKPADIFALGMIILEMAGNVCLPENGTSWQRLRSGDMTDVPSLTSSSDSNLVRDASGNPVDNSTPNTSRETLCFSDGEDSMPKFVPEGSPTPMRVEDCVRPPNFMVDPNDEQALDRIVSDAMLAPDYRVRPTAYQVLQLNAVQWVDKRRRAGATVFEGNYGPSDHVLSHDRDIEMSDAN